LEGAIISNTIYYTNKFTFRQKESKYLFIFSEVPTWIIGNSILLNILNFFKQGNTFEKFFINSNILDNNNKNEYKSLLESLIEKNILTTEQFFLSENYFNKNNVINNFILGLTNKCNLRCSSCYNSYTQSLDNEINISELTNLIDDILPFLTYGFSISGGEPFCRKTELFYILDYITSKNLGTKIGIVSNGTLITEEDAKKLSLIPNLTVQISLDGITKEAHEFNRGPNTFDKVINTIKLLRKYNVNVLLGVLLTEKSIHQVKDVLDFALSYDIKNVRFIEMFWQGLSRSKSMKRPLSYELFPIYKTLLKNNKSYKKILQKDSTKIILNSLLNPSKRKCCGIDSDTVYVDSDCNVYPCNLLINEKFKMGNIREQSFKNIWLHSNIKKDLLNLTVDKFENCKTCELKYICGGGCRGTAFNFNENIESQPPNCTDKKKTLYSYLWDFAEEDSISKLLK
jgi:radical SAM protein with 4Fe4S-binding SPASM domain